VTALPPVEAVNVPDAVITTASQLAVTLAWNNAVGVVQLTEPEPAHVALPEIMTGSAAGTGVTGFWKVRIMLPVQMGVEPIAVSA
jgi:hypothetical protein